MVSSSGRADSTLIKLKRFDPASLLNLSILDSEVSLLFSWAHAVTIAETVPVSEKLKERFMLAIELKMSANWTDLWLDMAKIYNAIRESERQPKSK